LFERERKKGKKAKKTHAGRFTTRHPNKNPVHKKLIANPSPAHANLDGEINATH
jgi:hypothetical protein